MKEINLTQGKVAIVDDADFEEMSRHKWCFSKGYAIRGVIQEGKKWTTLPMHVAIMGKIEGLEIDHVSGNRLDNRRENLRRVTRSQNNQNQAPCRPGTSQYKGVYWFKRVKLWRAQIKIDKKGISLGYYNSETEAATAYNNAAIKHFGQYARLNTIKEG